MEADRKKTPVMNGAAAPGSDEVVSLSPFEVVSDTKGYYASNTMSGTRGRSDTLFLSRLTPW